MARLIRLEFPSAAYHVTSRRNARQAIFLDKDDRGGDERISRAHGDHAYRRGKKLSIWDFIIPASAGISDELKTSKAAGQEYNIARPDPMSCLDDSMS